MLTFLFLYYVLPWFYGKAIINMLVELQQDQEMSGKYSVVMGRLQTFAAVFMHLLESIKSSFQKMFARLLRFTFNTLLSVGSSHPFCFWEEGDVCLNESHSFMPAQIFSCPSSPCLLCCFVFVFVFCPELPLDFLIL